MAETKQPAGGKSAPAAEDQAFIQNNTRTPWIISMGVTLKPNRITAVPAKLWAAFKDTPHGQTLLADEAIEQSSAEAAAKQTSTPAELEAEREADDRTARQGPTKRSSKK